MTPYQIKTKNKKVNLLGPIMDLVFGKDETVGGHLVFRTECCEMFTPDLVYLVVSCTEGEKGWFFYAHGLVFQSVKDVVEYAVEIETKFRRSNSGEAPGWIDWLLLRKHSPPKAVLSSVTICIFDALSLHDVRITVEFETGKVLERIVCSRTKETLEKAPDDMRCITASQLARVGICGLSLAPFRSSGIPVQLVHVVPVERGVALSFCKRHKDFAKGLNDLLPHLLAVETRWGDSVTDWIEETFPESLERTLLSMQVAENPASGLRLGRMALEQNPANAELVLAHVRLLLQQQAAPSHCVSMLERIPELTTDAALRKKSQLLLSAALAASNDVLGCLDLMNKLDWESPSGRKIEFPLVLISNTHLDTIGTELWHLVDPKLASLFSLGPIHDDPILWCLSFIRDWTMVKAIVAKGNQDGSLNATLWQKLVLLNNVVSARDHVIDKRSCLAYAIAWHRLGLHEASYGALVSALRNFDVTKKGAVLFSSVVLICVELAASCEDGTQRESYAKDAAEAAKQMTGNNKNRKCSECKKYCFSLLEKNFIVERALKRLKEQQVIEEEEM